MENVCIEDNDATETYYRMDMNPTEKKVTKVYEKWYLIQHYKGSLNTDTYSYQGPWSNFVGEAGRPEKGIKAEYLHLKSCLAKNGFVMIYRDFTEICFFLQRTTKNLVVAFALLLVVVGATSMIAFLLKVQDEEKGYYSNNLP